MLQLNSKGYSFDERNGGKNPVEDLQGLLCGECTSFNSFDNCLQSQLASSLHDVSAMCRDLHAVNISLIKQRLTEMGAEPKETTDLWHVLGGLLSTTAAFLGEDALLAAFRKSELDLFDEYQGKIQSFDSENLLLMQQQLIPNQLRVCELLGATRGGAPEEPKAPVIPLDLNLA